jgi:hypothetical protein
MGQWFDPQRQQLEKVVYLDENSHKSQRLHSDGRAVRAFVRQK